MIFHDSLSTKSQNSIFHSRDFHERHSFFENIDGQRAPSIYLKKRERESKRGERPRRNFPRAYLKQINAVNSGSVGAAERNGRGG